MKIQLSSLPSFLAHLYKGKSVKLELVSPLTKTERHFSWKGSNSDKFTLYIAMHLPQGGRQGGYDIESEVKLPGFDLKSFDTCLVILSELFKTHKPHPVHIFKLTSFLNFYICYDHIYLHCPLLFLFSLLLTLLSPSSLSLTFMVVIF